jgi:uncharacterized protein with GYD domain
MSKEKQGKQALRTDHAYLHHPVQVHGPGNEERQRVTEATRGTLKAFEAAGGKNLGVYYTLGEYDLVSVGEIPSEEAGAAYALSIGALGNVRSTTLRAFTPKEFAEIIKKIA